MNDFILTLMVPGWVYISIKQIIESHDGIIYAKSDGKGKGTTFSVILPNVVGKQIKKNDR
ncbi:hypothetical protein ACU8V7_01810 [Zobellia nedashkovskayae]